MSFPTTYIEAGVTKRLPNPSLPIKETINFNVGIQRMASGLEQRRKQGIPIKSFELSYKVLTQTQYDVIYNFIVGQNGPGYPFLWTHPATKIVYNVRVKENAISSSYFGHNVKGALWTISLTVEQVL